MILNPEKEMNPSWLFTDKSEIWSKCNKCGEWNKIAEKGETDKFRASPEKPFENICDVCKRKGIFVERVWFARKGMKYQKTL